MGLPKTPTELPDQLAANVPSNPRELLANAIRFDTNVPDKIFVVNEDGIELLTVFIADVLPNSLPDKSQNFCGNSPPPRCALR